MTVLISTDFATVLDNCVAISDGLNRYLRRFELLLNRTKQQLVGWATTQFATQSAVLRRFDTIANLKLVL